MLKVALAGVFVALTLAGAVVAGPVEDGLAAYARGDYATALKLFRPLAEQGDAQAQFNLGLIYRFGGSSQNLSESAEWFRKAAEQGNASAQNSLGVVYSQGDGVTQDHAEAVKWFSRAAEQNDAEGQLNLGFAYFRGRGVPMDYVLAYKWLSLRQAHTDSNSDAAVTINWIVDHITPSQLAEAQQLVLEWKPRPER